MKRYAVKIEEDPWFWRSWRWHVMDAAHNFRTVAGGHAFTESRAKKKVAAAIQQYESKISYELNWDVEDAERILS